jgi:hypothetical protein
MTEEIWFALTKPNFLWFHIKFFPKHPLFLFWDRFLLQTVFYPCKLHVLQCQISFHLDLSLGCMLAIQAVLYFFAGTIFSRPSDMNGRIILLIYKIYLHFFFQKWNQYFLEEISVDFRLHLGGYDTHYCLWMRTKNCSYHNRSTTTSST